MSWSYDTRGRVAGKGQTVASITKSVGYTYTNAAGAVQKVNILQAMGFDLASVHAAASLGVRALRADLKKRPRGWLNAAAKTAVAAVKRDYREWRS